MGWTMEQLFRDGIMPRENVLSKEAGIQRYHAPVG